MKDNDFDRLSEIIAEHIDDLQRLAMSWYEDMEAVYREKEELVLAIIEDAFARYRKSGGLTYARIKILNAMKKKVYDIRKQCYEETFEDLEKKISELVGAEDDFYAMWIAALCSLSASEKARQTGVEDVKKMSEINKEDIRKYGIYNGDTVKNIFSEISDKGANAIYKAARNDIVIGSSWEQTKNNVVKTINRFSKSLELNTAIVANGISNDVAVVTADRNPKLVEGVMWVTALDERVCDDCSSNEGVIYFDGNEPPCPLHANCRCHLIPVTREIEDSARAIMGGKP